MAAMESKLPLEGRNQNRVEMELDRVLKNSYLLLPSRYDDPLIGSIIAMTTTSGGEKLLVNFGKIITTYVYGNARYNSLRDTAETFSETGVEYVDIFYPVPSNTRLDIEFMSTDLRKRKATQLQLVTREEGISIVTFVEGELRGVPQDLSNVVSIVMTYKAEAILHLPGDMDFALKGLDEEYITQELRSMIAERYETPDVISERLFDGRIQSIVIGSREYRYYSVHDGVITRRNREISLEELASEVATYGISGVNIIWLIPEGVEIDEYKPTYDDVIDYVSLGEYLEIDFLSTFLTRGG